MAGMWFWTDSVPVVLERFSPQLKVPGAWSFM
jgi:hypothetical protein